MQTETETSEPIEPKPEFRIDSEDAANWYLRKLAALETEKQRVTAQAALIVKQLDADAEGLRYLFPSYLVNVNAGREKCTCEGFAKDKDCKHRIACAIKHKALQETAEAAYVEKMFAQWEETQEETQMWETICGEVDARAEVEF